MRSVDTVAVSDREESVLARTRSGSTYWPNSAVKANGGCGCEQRQERTELFLLYRLIRCPGKVRQGRQDFSLAGKMNGNRETWNGTRGRGGGKHPPRGIRWRRSTGTEGVEKKLFLSICISFVLPCIFPSVPLCTNTFLVSLSAGLDNSVWSEKSH